MKKLIKSLLYTGYIAFVFLIFDLGVGFLYPKVAPFYGKKNLEIFSGEIDPNNVLNERPHPYMLFENTPKYVDSDGIKQTNAHGYRNSKDFAPLPAPDTLRILCLGGSTTYGYLLNSPDDAWPTQLEKILNDSLNKEPVGNFKKIEVVNGGLTFATSAEFLAHYLFRDRYLKSTIVIVHTGINDAAPLLYHDYSPEYVHFRPGWNAPVHRLRRGEKFFIQHVNTIKLFYAYWLNDSVALPYIHKRGRSFSLSESYYIENARKNSPVGFERNLDVLLRNIIADEAKPILFFDIWPSEQTFSMMPPGAIAWVKNIRKGVTIAVKKNNDVMRKLSNTYQIPLLTIPDEMITTEHFLDYCHLSRKGERIKAKFVAENIRHLFGEPYSF